MRNYVVTDRDFDSFLKYANNERRLKNELKSPTLTVMQRRRVEHQLALNVKALNRIPLPPTPEVIPHSVSFAEIEHEEECVGLKVTFAVSNLPVHPVCASISIAARTAQHVGYADFYAPFRERVVIPMLPTSRGTMIFSVCIPEIAEATEWQIRYRNANGDDSAPVIIGTSKAVTARRMA
jgi:hypothetical protein